MSILRWFVAGALAVPLFHQVGLLLLNVAGLTDRTPFPMAPTQPFGVPQLISISFWGGVWGVILGFVLRRTRGAAFWVIACVVGALAPTLAALFVVPPLKGETAGFNREIFIGGLILNSAWGLGTAALYKVATVLFTRSEQR